jgi:lysophospholipase L1-like esterase
MKNICVFGASISSGLNDFQEGGWCGRLKKQLLPKGYLVNNLGIIGESSTELLQRFESECVPRKPDGIIIAIGCNDSQFLMDEQRVRVELHETIQNFEQLIDLARKFTTQVVVLGLTPVEEERINPIFMQEKRKIYLYSWLVSYDLSIEYVAIQKGVPFIPTMDVLDGSDLDDGLHPNSKGHEKLYETILKQLQSFRWFESCQQD